MKLVIDEKASAAPPQTLSQGPPVRLCYHTGRRLSQSTVRSHASWNAHEASSLFIPIGNSQKIVLPKIQVSFLLYFRLI